LGRLQAKHPEAQLLARGLPQVGLSLETIVGGSARFSTVFFLSNFIVSSSSWPFTDDQVPQAIETPGPLDFH
jgi:hypothetical protein